MCSRVMCVRCNCSTQREWVLENRLKKPFGKLTGKVKKKLFSAYENESCIVEWWCTVEGGWFPVEYGDIEATFFDENAYRAKHQSRQIKEHLPIDSQSTFDNVDKIPADLLGYSGDINTIKNLFLDPEEEDQNQEIIFLDIDPAYGVSKENAGGYYLWTTDEKVDKPWGRFNSPEEILRHIIENPITT